MVVDGRAGWCAGRGEGVVAALVLELLWRQASEAEGRLGEGVELQLKKQVKAAADIREGTSSVGRNGR